MRRIGWRSKNVLDFDITCPVIDGEISALEDSIDRCLSVITEKDDSDAVGRLVDAIKPHLEKVRQTNIAMRAAADEQIEGLNDEIEDLKDKLADRDGEIRRLEARVADLEWELKECGGG